MTKLTDDVIEIVKVGVQRNQTAATIQQSILEQLDIVVCERQVREWRMRLEIEPDLCEVTLHQTARGRAGGRTSSLSAEDLTKWSRLVWASEQDTDDLRQRPAWSTSAPRRADVGQPGR